MARQEYITLNNETRERYRYWFESAFFAKKINGQWKITSAAGAIARDYEVIKLPPEAQ